MQKKKICIIEMDATNVSGATHVLINLANGLIDYYDIHVVSVFGNQATASFPIKDQVHFVRLFEGNGRIWKHPLRTIRSIRNYFIEHEIDLVMALGMTVTPLVLMGAKRTKAKVVVCEHQNLLNPYASDITQRISQKMATIMANKVVTLTEKDAENYRKMFKLSPQKVTSIYNWMDPKLFENKYLYAKDSRRIMTVGRVEELKGIPYIIEIAEKVLKKHPEWKWDIYGGGKADYLHWTNETIEKKGLKGKLVLRGIEKNIYQKYAEYSLFAMASLTEGLPMVLLEAKANHLPIVSFDCETGPSEIIQDGINGYLIPLKDSEQFADKLDKLMSSPDLRQDFSNHAMDNGGRFQKEKILSQWISLIKELTD